MGSCHLIVHPNFDPVAISIGPLSIHWYGLMYLCGFGAGLWLGRYRARRPDSGWQVEEITNLVFYMAMGAIVGGRLGYVVFYSPGYYLSNPFEALALWQGGMSFHGGVVGVLAAIWLYAKQTRRTVLAVADFLVPLVPPGLLLVGLATSSIRNCGGVSRRYPGRSISIPCPMGYAIPPSCMRPCWRVWCCLSCFGGFP